jgi:CheY-like chemotaxis protein
MPLPPEISNPGDPGKLRVLVVDDSRVTADSLVQLLTAWGHDARAEYDGLAALRLAEEFLPEVALVDLGLPGLDGYQVAVRLREQAGSRRLVLVAVTGFDWKGAPARSRDYGFDHHRTKPINPDELEALLTQIRQQLGGGAVTGPA